ncbi:hypothetical protein EAH89_30550 [Roseomonas nepalensis]|uniref:Uncharacterized protein n=2 Tax=Muricoccus nepalensis TaxID=1854500 RepID=A0A502EGH5_9PROT|nr:hypothetical protein EAH89_30550 [Roseomonas nepalensis]
MSLLASRLDAAAVDLAASMTRIFFTLDGVEHELAVPIVANRWELVARAVGLQRGREARTTDAPAYDTGTRSWCLPVEVQRRWRRPEVVSVGVRW